MLSPALGPVEEDAYRKGRQDGDALLPGDVQAGDVVVLHDPIAAALARPIRDRGAHAIWSTSIGRWESGVCGLAVSAPLEAGSRRVYHRVAIRSARQDRRGPDRRIHRAPSVISAKEVDASRSGQGYEEIGWTTLLADVVRDDRAERVGGTVRARPSVAPR